MSLNCSKGSLGQASGIPFECQGEEPRLPRDVREPPSLKILKNKLDKHLSRMI